MSTSQDIRQRIEARISQGEFLANLLRLSATHSGEVQATFISTLSSIAEAVRSLLEVNGLLRKFSYRPASYWPELRGRTFAFLDGGVASIDLPSAAPIGVRVGSYFVKPGDTTAEREQFNIELSIVDDLYSERGVLYDDDFDDVAKLRDAARIICEAAASYRVAKGIKAPTPDAILLHGPLVNPASPYGLSDFPPFGLKACQEMLGDDSWNGNEREREFVAFYLVLLERLRETRTPVVGVVERAVGKEPVVLRNILRGLQDQGILPLSSLEEIMANARAFALNDASLFDVVLQAGEYIAPMAVNRQGLEGKWPDGWKEQIRTYPSALTTYLKPAELVLPFRVEAFEGDDSFESVLDLVFHTSRLLPSYGFPVGLDIVDKFAKVPAWMSRGVRGQHSIVLLQKALASGDPTAMAFAKRVLMAKGRDWLFRPSA